MITMENYHFWELWWGLGGCWWWVLSLSLSWTSSIWFFLVMFFFSYLSPPCIFFMPLLRLDNVILCLKCLWILLHGAIKNSLISMVNFLHSISSPDICVYDQLKCSCSDSFLNIFRKWTVLWQSRDKTKQKSLPWVYPSLTPLLPWLYFCWSKLSSTHT